MTPYKIARDKAAEEYFSEYGPNNSTELEIFKAGHDHGVFKSREVLALVEALEETAERIKFSSTDGNKVFKALRAWQRARELHDASHAYIDAINIQRPLDKN